MAILAISHNSCGIRQREKSERKGTLGLGLEDVASTGCVGGMSWIRSSAPDTIRDWPQSYEETRLLAIIRSNWLWASKELSEGPKFVNAMPARSTLGPREKI